MIIDMFDFTFESDGCTGLPDGPDSMPCFIHDVEYSLGGTSRDRLRADLQLRNHLYRHGKHIFGNLCYMATRLWGGRSNHWANSSIIDYPENFKGPIRAFGSRIIIEPAEDPEWRNSLIWNQPGFDILQYTIKFIESGYAIGCPIE